LKSDGPYEITQDPNQENDPELNENNQQNQEEKNEKLLASDGETIENNQENIDQEIEKQLEKNNENPGPDPNVKKMIKIKSSFTIGSETLSHKLILEALDYMINNGDDSLGNFVFDPLCTIKSIFI